MCLPQVRFLPINTSGSRVWGYYKGPSLGDKVSTPCPEDSLEENTDLVQKQSGG